MNTCNIRTSALDFSSAILTCVLTSWTSQKLFTDFILLSLYFLKREKRISKYMVPYHTYKELVVIGQSRTSTAFPIASTKGPKVVRWMLITDRHDGHSHCKHEGLQGSRCTLIVTIKYYSSTGTMDVPTTSTKGCRVVDVHKVIQKNTWFRNILFSHDQKKSVQSHVIFFWRITVNRWLNRGVTVIINLCTITSILEITCSDYIEVDKIDSIYLTIY